MLAYGHTFTLPSSESLVYQLYLFLVVVLFEQNVRTGLMSMRDRMMCWFARVCALFTVRWLRFRLPVFFTDITKRFIIVSYDFIVEMETLRLAPNPLVSRLIKI